MKEYDVILKLLIILSRVRIRHDINIYKTFYYQYT
jgi:hypothetical protein